MPNIADLLRLAARQAAAGLRLGASLLELVGGTAADAAETVSVQAQQTVGGAAAQAGQVAGQAAGQAADVVEGVAAQAGQVVGQAADAAQGAAAQAAEVVEGVAGEAGQVAGQAAQAAGQAAQGAASEATGAAQAAAPEEADLDVGDPQASSAPKDLDDVTIARKIETEIFRDRRVPKSKIDVNVADGVAYIRGEAKTPRQINQIEEKAAAIPEVVRVENLLHLPKTPASTRTDTPDSMRKPAGRRTRPKSADVHLHAEPVTAERPPETRDAEEAPAELARARRGRQPAPMSGQAKGSGGGSDGGATNGNAEPIAELPAAGETSPETTGSLAEADAAAGAPMGEADEGGSSGSSGSGTSGSRGSSSGSGAFAGDGGTNPTPTTGTTRPRGVVPDGADS